MKAKARDEATLLDVVLRMLASTNKTAARKLIKSKRVAVDGEITGKPDFALSPGASIEITPAKKSGSRDKATKGPATRQRRLPFPVLMEDEYLIVVDKPAGLLSIATNKEKLKTLYRMVSDHVKRTSDGEKKIFIVHRLDREVSGVMVLAKDQHTKRVLQKEWASAEKTYQAVVEGRPQRAEGTIKNHLCENRAGRVYVCKSTTEGAQEAVTHYKVLRHKTRSLLEVRIETGRKHQIRVHLAGMDCPIVGDKFYGLGSAGGGIALHAHKLSFTHPHTGARVTLKSPMPGKFRGMV